MTLSFLGFFNGITALISMIISIIIGLFFFYQSKRKKAALLNYAGLMIIFASFLYLGVSIDFLSCILIGYNMNNEIGLRGILSYMWVPFTLILAIYIGTKLMNIEKKKIIITFYIIMALIYWYFLFTDPFGTFDFIYPTNSGDELIDTSFNETSITFILIAFFLISGFLIDGVGFLLLAIKSSGFLRRRFLYLSIGVVIFCISGAFEALFSLGILLLIIRILLILSAVFFYIGLKRA